MIKPHAADLVVTQLLRRLQGEAVLSVPLFLSRDAEVSLLNFLQIPGLRVTQSKGPHFHRLVLTLERGDQ